MTTSPADTALRVAASKHVGGSQLEAFLNITNAAKFVGPDGSIDEAAVAQRIAALLPPAPAAGGSKGSDFKSRPSDLDRQRQRLGINPRESTHAQATEIQVKTGEKPAAFNWAANNIGPPPGPSLPNSAAEIAHQRDRLGFNNDR